MRDWGLNSQPVKSFSLRILQRQSAPKFSLSLEKSQSEQKHPGVGTSCNREQRVKKAVGSDREAVAWRKCCTRSWSSRIMVELEQSWEWGVQNPEQLWKTFHLLGRNFSFLFIFIKTPIPKKSLCKSLPLGTKHTHHYHEECSFGTQRTTFNKHFIPTLPKLPSACSVWETLLKQSWSRFPQLLQITWKKLKLLGFNVSWG